jgi:alginate O-acetyltransferase complex protein AlgI
VIVGVVGVLAAAPVYWLVVPARWRRAALTAGSLAALAALDPRLPLVVAVVAAAVSALGRRIAARPGRAATALATLAVACLVVLFVWNKRGGAGLAVVPSQRGLALLGVSYLTLKAVGALVDAARDGEAPPRLGDALGWLAFWPTYTAGPIEPAAHWLGEPLVFDRALVLGGLERILVGLLKALVAAHWLGKWTAPVLAAPEAYGRGTLALALYGATLRFYFDFAGYSDLAVGAGALFGYHVEENFDWPLVRRNLVQLWQRWHMTLTRWLRTYVFVPASRSLLRRDPPGGDATALAAAQVGTMVVCGLWHGVTAGFLLWGLAQGVGLAWVSVAAPALGARLPARLVERWRASPLAHGVGVGCTVSFFSLTLVFATTDLDHAWRVARRVLGG